MVNPVRRETDPRRTARALAFAARIAEREGHTDAEEATAFRFALESGASIAEISAATGRPESIIVQLVDRSTV